MVLFGKGKIFTMANNVQNIIEITYKPNPVVYKFFEKIGNILKNNESLSNLYEGNEDTRDWWEENVGAKWAYIEDFDLDEDYCRITLVSAWSPIESFVEFIDKSTGNVAHICFQYIDEMPNFAGYNIRKNGKIIEEKDVPDMWELIDEEAEVRKIKENVVFNENFTESDWKWDWMWDFVYDTIDPELNNV